MSSITKACVNFLDFIKNISIIDGFIDKLIEKKGIGYFNEIFKSSADIVEIQISCAGLFDKIAYNDQIAN